jgi:hypothetical protein
MRARPRIDPAAQELLRIAEPEMMAEIGGLGERLGIGADAHAALFEPVEIGLGEIGDTEDRRVSDHSATPAARRVAGLQAAAAVEPAALGGVAVEPGASVWPVPATSR